MAETSTSSRRLRASIVGKLPPHLAAAVCVSQSIKCAHVDVSQLRADTVSYRSCSQPFGSDSLGVQIEIDVGVNENGDLILDDEEYARRKLDWVDRYTRVESLREQFGKNRNFWGDLGPASTRRLYLALLPQALMGLYDARLMRPHELAPLAYEARRAAKEYARERSRLHIRLAVKAFDGYRSFRDGRKFSTNGLEWEQIWAKYEKRIAHEFQFSEERDGEASLEITKQVCLAILDSSCRTNEGVNRQALGDLEAATAQGKEKESMDSISAKLDEDIKSLLSRKSRLSSIFKLSAQKVKQSEDKKARRRASISINRASINMRSILSETQEEPCEHRKQHKLNEDEYFLLRILEGDTNDTSNINADDFLGWLRSEAATEI